MMFNDSKTVLLFMRNEILDHRGRKYEDLLKLDDFKMEQCHDHIQWMFPLHEISKYAETYPVLTKKTVDEAKKDENILNNLRKALDRFERFLAIGKYDDVNKQRRWCQDRNHNLLRITRVIRSLRLFGLNDESTEFYNKVLKTGTYFGISPQTVHYWKKAYNEDVWESLQD